MEKPRIDGCQFQHITCSKNPKTSWWLNQPIWKILYSQIGSFSQIGMKKKQPPRKHRGIVCLAILLVTFWGWWKRDPFKGCWWPPTRGSNGHFESPGVYYSILADVFWISHSCHLLGLVGSIWSPVEGYQITKAGACFLASIPTHRREGKHIETWKDFRGTRTKHEKNIYQHPCKTKYRKQQNKKHLLY